MAEQLWTHDLTATRDNRAFSNFKPIGLLLKPGINFQFYPTAVLIVSHNHAFQAE